MKQFFFVLFIFLYLQSCRTNAQIATNNQVIVGAEQPELYLSLLKGKNVALVVNHTSTVNQEHLVDFLLKEKINIKKIFAPEHGFRGEASAGDVIENEIDKKTGLPLLSLHGSSKKPTAQQLADIDYLVFDIQDVGVRFYTYISTLYYILQAAAENNKAVLILDRPNPNGHYIDGPVLNPNFKSFVGIAPIPVVHGCTIGELAQLFNGEKWIGEKQCKIEVVKVKNYTHQTPYLIPIKPSPNLPNNQAIWLYPSICFFEPTQISVGRGTDLQFQVIGGPDKSLGSYTFTPVDKPGAINPPNEGIECYGQNLENVDAYNQHFTLKYLIDFYAKFGDKAKFFTNERFFNLLMGNDWVVKELKNGKTEMEIRELWQPELQKFIELRKKYVLYP